MNPLVSAALRSASRSLAAAAKEKASAPLSLPSWRMDGSGFALAEKGPGLWRASVDPADPLRLVHVPTGRMLLPPFREFDTDLASVPAVLSRLSTPALHLRPNSFPKAAAFHDAVYSAGWCWVVESGLASRATVTRAQADGILYICLACEGATVADGLSYNAGVRLGGASHWAAARAAPPDFPPLFDTPEATHVQPD